MCGNLVLRPPARQGNSKGHRITPHLHGPHFHGSRLIPSGRHLGLDVSDSPRARGGAPAAVALPSPPHWPVGLTYSFGVPADLVSLVAPLGWNLSVALGLEHAGQAIHGHQGTQTPRLGFSWPIGTLALVWLPHVCPATRCAGGHPSPDTDVARHPRDSGLPPFQGSPSSRGHARPRALLLLPPGLTWA